LGFGFWVLSFGFAFVFGFWFLVVFGLPEVRTAKTKTENGPEPRNQT
jgi:hypothetical protein